MVIDLFVQGAFLDEVLKWDNLLNLIAIVFIWLTFKNNRRKDMQTSIETNATKDYVKEKIKESEERTDLKIETTSSKIESVHEVLQLVNKNVCIIMKKII